MNFNNSRLVDHKPMKFGTFVPYMYRFVIIVKYLINFFKLKWNLGIKFTLRFFFLSVYKTYNYQTLHSASPRCTDSAGILTRWPWPIFCAPVTLTHFALTFDISSTIRPTTIKPCKVLLLNVLTGQIPWPGDLDLYFGCSDFDIIYVNVPDLFKCKTSSHQTFS